MPKSNYLPLKAGLISSSNETTEHSKAELRWWDTESRVFLSSVFFFFFLECGGIGTQICPGEWKRVSFLFSGQKRPEQPPLGEACGWAAERVVSQRTAFQKRQKHLPSKCQLFCSAPQRSPNLLLPSYYMYKYQLQYVH